MADNLYIRNSNGRFVPISFKSIAVQEWEDKLIVVKLGSDEFPASEEDEEEVYEVIGKSDVLEELKGTSYIITKHNITFEVLDTLKNIQESAILVRINSTDPHHKLKELEKEIKEQFKDKTKKVIFLPAPLTFQEYTEISEIKRRCDLRRSRRGK